MNGSEECYELGSGSVLLEWLVKGFCVWRLNIRVRRVSERFGEMVGRLGRRIVGKALEEDVSVESDDYFRVAARSLVEAWMPRGLVQQQGA